MSTSKITTVLVVGATGSIGRHVVTAAQRQGLSVRALVRDVTRAAQVLPDVELVEGDLERHDNLTAAVEGIDAIVFTHGGRGSTEAARRVDYGGVVNVLRALNGRPVRIALMTSIGVTHTSGQYAGLLDWKRRSERVVRACGQPYTIVRPSWFDAVGPNERTLVLGQGDSTDGGVARVQIAEVLVHSLLSEGARKTTFELAAEAGAEPSNWDAVFAPLTPDQPGVLDAALDRPSVPVDAEPAELQQDLRDLSA